MGKAASGGEARGQCNSSSCAQDTLGGLGAGWGVGGHPLHSHHKFGELLGGDRAPDGSCAPHQQRGEAGGVVQEVVAADVEGVGCRLPQADAAQHAQRPAVALLAGSLRPEGPVAPWV